MAAQRTLKFPDRSLGYLYLVDRLGVIGRHDEYTVSLGEAKGIVEVPDVDGDNWFVQLTLTDGTPLNELKFLRDEDIQSLVYTSNNSWSSVISDDFIGNILHVHELVELFLAGTSLTDAAIPTITKLPDLRLLGLSKSFVTDRGISELAALKKLEKLYLFETLVTKEGVEELQRALPACTIFWSQGDERWKIVRPLVVEVLKLRERVKASSDPKLFAKLGELFMEISEFVQGLKYFDRAIQLAPADGDMRRRRGVARARAMMHDAAVEDFTKAIELNPKDALAICQRGIMHLDLFEFDEAKADFERALKVDENNSAVHLELGRMYVFKSDKRQAHTHFNKAIKADSSNADAFYERGLLYDDKKQYEKAVADFSKAIELKDCNINALIARSKALEASGRIDEAIKDWQVLTDYAMKHHESYNYTHKIEQYKCKQVKS